jgi:hypothetical protein
VISATFPSTLPIDWPACHRADRSGCGFPVIRDVRRPEGTAISTLLLRVNALRTGQLNVAGIVCPADGSDTLAGM